MCSEIVKWLYECNFILSITAFIILEDFSNPKCHMLHMNWTDRLRNCFFPQHIHSQTFNGNSCSYKRSFTQNPIIFKMQSLYNIQVLIWYICEVCKIRHASQWPHFKLIVLFLGCGKAQCLKKKCFAVRKQI